MKPRVAKTASTPIVQMQSIDKVYFTQTIETHALSQISLQIAQGDYLLVQGPSGSGKSTLLAILGLLEEPTNGLYLLRGADTQHLSLTERARLRNRELGFVFQSYNLIHNLTLCENVELPLRYAQPIAKAERRDKAMHLLDEVGIAHRADHYPAQLSGGQQQRAALARALVRRPSLLLADEPTGNLDAGAEHAVIELLQNSHEKGTTICVVSHNPLFEAVASRVLELSEGLLINENSS